MFGKGGKKGFVGLDIGSSAIKAIELRQNRGGFDLVHIGHQILQSDTIVDGHIIDLNHVSDVINRIWVEQQIKTTSIATAISGHSVIVKKILLPQMSTEELDEQIQWEAEQYIPFDINDVNLYHEVTAVDPQASQMEVMLVACKRDKIAQFTQVISQAGGGKTPVIVDVCAFALQNAYEINYAPPPDLTVALLDIGASVMTLNVVRGTNSIFTRDVSAGGNQYTDLLQKEMSLTFEQAEALKRGVPTDEGVTLQDALPSIQSVTEMLALEIQRTLDFFRATVSSDSTQVDRMLLSGGSSKVVELTDYLAERFGIPVERFDAFRSINFDKKKVDEEQLREMAPNMAIAVGLASRVAEDR
jgi:type IV pilus assembly protein PilM